MISGILIILLGLCAGFIGDRRYFNKVKNTFSANPNYEELPADDQKKITFKNGGTSVLSVVVIIVVSMAISSLMFLITGDPSSTEMSSAVFNL